MSEIMITAGADAFSVAKNDGPRNDDFFFFHWFYILVK